MNENMIKLAVILVNYNGIDDSIDCIRSLKKSSIPLTIIIVDNASSKDESIKLKDLFPDIYTMRSEINLGFAGGNNIAIKWALENNFDYIALLNNDTIVKNNTFEELCKYAGHNDIVAPYMYYYSNPKELWYAGGFINHWSGNATHNKKEKKHDIACCTFATGCCFLAHRNVWEKVGLLDESYFMYNEDVDYCIRLLSLNVVIKTNPKASIYHKVGKSCGGEISSFQIYYMTRNRILVIKKFPHFFHITAMPFTILSRILWGIKFFFQGKKEWTFFFKGIRDGIKGVKGKVNL